MEIRPIRARLEKGPVDLINQSVGFTVASTQSTRGESVLAPVGTSWSGMGLTLANSTGVTIDNVQTTAVFMLKNKYRRQNLCFPRKILD